MSETFHVTIKQMCIAGSYSAGKELVARTINIVCTELAAPWSQHCKYQDRLVAKVYTNYRSCMKYIRADHTSLTVAWAYGLEML